MTSPSSSSPEISAAISSNPQPEQFSYKHATHDEVLEELASRFIVNLPDEELDSLERICFQVEQAHWFYEDFIREENPKLPTLPLKKFSAMLFLSCPLLHRWRHMHEEAYNKFMAYKTRVPVCGAIMLNGSMDKCVLVKGWKASSGWGFPKGKINQSEPPSDCAIREVLEETGYDLAGQLIPEDVLTVTIKEQTIYLYIVSGIPEDYPFQTKTRKEISKIEWFRLVDLPTWRRNKAVPGKFYLISPFISFLKAHVNSRRPRSVRKTRPSPAPTLPTTEEEEESMDVTETGGYAESDVLQESSSQSSSGDNGDPQTPSPQYIQAIANAVPHIAASQPDTLDPHMARLLSSLTLSVSSTGPRDTPNSGSTAATSKPSNKSSPERRNLLDPQYSGVPSIPVPNSPSPRVLSPRGSSPSSRRPLSRPTPAVPPSPPSPPIVASPLSPRIRGLGSRRTSSTADISPYLSRPLEPPSSAKTLRQLALLEAIANESEKMTPTLSTRGLPPVRPEATSTHSAISSPSVSNDLHVIYSSHPAAGLSGAALPHPNSITPAPHHPLPGHPFQIRPHTSHSYHRGMAYPPPGTLNPNQGPPYMSITNSSYNPFLFNHTPMPPQAFTPQRQTFPTIVPTAVATLMQPFVSVPAPSHLPQPPVNALPHLSHTSAPLCESPGFGPPGSLSSNPLLSILNNNVAQP